MSTPLELTEALLAVTDEAMRELGLRFDEAKGEYYYETVNVKRWVTDGNSCEICEDNADRGWIEDDDVFETDQFGDVDGPPGHYHCACDLEYSERRHRVYV